MAGALRREHSRLVPLRPSWGPRRTPPAPGPVHLDAAAPHADVAGVREDPAALQEQDAALGGVQDRGALALEGPVNEGDHHVLPHGGPVGVGRRELAAEDPPLQVWLPARAHLGPVGQAPVGEHLAGFLLDVDDDPHRGLVERDEVAQGVVPELREAVRSLPALRQVLREGPDFRLGGVREHRGHPPPSPRGVDRHHQARLARVLPGDHPHVVTHAEVLPDLPWQHVQEVLQLLVLRLDHHAPGGRHFVHDAHEVFEVALHDQHRVPLAVRDRRGR